MALDSYARHPMTLINDLLGAVEATVQPMQAPRTPPASRCDWLRWQPAAAKLKCPIRAVRFTRRAALPRR